MYPAGAKTYVLVEGLSDKLDGASRPGHFRGVATVVTKLFEIVRPDCAFFGQKDAAQVAVLRKMVNDLDMDVEMVVCPIVREKDGLAMSSRNVYLTPEQRQQALVLHRALMRVQMSADQGERDAAKLAEIGKTGDRGRARRAAGLSSPSSILTRLIRLPNVTRGALVAVAAYFGTTRLIDNLADHRRVKVAVALPARDPRGTQQQHYRITLQCVTRLGIGERAQEGRAQRTNSSIMPR